MHVLLQQVNANTLPHAVLFVAGPRTDLDSAIQVFAKSLLCENAKQNQSCGICKSCQLLAAQTHPDYCVLTGEGKTNTISIDTIRSITDFCEQTPQCADKKIIVIVEAENMNMAAYNALLKTLEEPVRNTYFFLGTHILAAIPATIRSRCQIVRLQLDESIKMPWQTELETDCLGLTQGKLDPLTMAQKWQKEEVDLVLNALYEYFAKIKNFECLDKITSLRKKILQHGSLNIQLQLESLLIDCAQLCRCS
jgi:DNA polymerase III delta prime subunit